MTLPVFYYANGTAWLWNYAGIQWDSTFIGGSLFGNSIGIRVDPTPVNVEGLDGETFYWDGFIPNDPFPQLLSDELWTFQRVPYPAQMVFMGPSIEIGVEWVISQILATPVGTPFALGGYSQGAAVMSRVYNECRQGRLADRRADLRAMVTFGNPMREANHTFPFSSGYSGAVDVPGSTRNGHGTFPAAADIPTSNLYARRFARLQNTDDLVWDFTMPGEVISGVGSSDEGRFLQQWTLAGLSQNPLAAVADIGRALGLWNEFGTQQIVGAVQDAVTGVVKVLDAITGLLIPQSGGGHIMYPFYPPPNADGSIPSSGETCYQIAAGYLNTVGARIRDELYPTVVAPTSRAGLSWFTSLPGG